MFELFFFLFFVGAIIIGIIIFIIKILFWVWVGKSAYDVYKVYNAQMEAGLRQLAFALQAQNMQQVRIMEQRMRQQVASLPSNERKVYQDKLNKVVKRDLELNPETGEWEEV